MSDYVLTWKKYKFFVNSRVIPEKDPYYTMCRAGIEFSEEYFEYISLNSLHELGDFLFWVAYFSEITGYDLMEIEVDFGPVKMSKIMADFIGYIKRFYRDKDTDKLIKIKETLPLLQYFIQLELKDKFKDISILDLALLNQQKLIKRHGK